MKTLDEVIAMLEAYPVTPSSLDFDVTIVRVSDIDDVLHYLKEYRERKEMLRYWGEKAISEQQNVADAYMLYKIASEKKQENLPLTWQELQQMEGKPVWLEVYDPIDGMTGWRTASWKLIEFINDEYFDVRDSDGEQECYYKSESEYWQAYREKR